MGARKVIDIVRRAETITQDSGIQWPRLEVQDWINESYGAILSLRPDANSIVAELTCAAGIRQSIAGLNAGAIGLLDVVRNTAVASNKSVIHRAERADIDQINPSWPALTQSDSIELYIYEQATPLNFLVYPPATTNAKVELVYWASVAPHELTADQLNPANSNAETLRLNDSFAPSILNWVLYRMYSKDQGAPANESRAAGYLNAFSVGLTGKTMADSGIGG